MRTTSTPTVQPPPSEAQMRASLAAYITAHLEAERIATDAKASIERLKKLADDEARPHNEAKAHHETILMRYAEGHPELFSKLRKHEVYGGHKIGYHTSPPAVCLVKPPGARKKQTWDGFLQACRDVGFWAMEFIRTKEEPDRDKVLAVVRAAELEAAEKNDIAILASVESDLARLGVKVEQEERFVIELNLQPEAARTMERNVTWIDVGSGKVTFRQRINPASLPSI